MRYFLKYRKKPMRNKISEFQIKTWLVTVLWWAIVEPKAERKTSKAERKISNSDPVFIYLDNWDDFGFPLSFVPEMSTSLGFSWSQPCVGAKTIS